MSWLLLAPVGLFVGASIGVVGGGGSLIAVPALVYLADQSPREAQATALLVVTLAAVAGLIGFACSGDVRWRAGVAFGLAAGSAALATSVLNARVDPDVLLLAFVPVMAAGAWLMASPRARRPASFVPWRFGVRRGEVVKVLLLGLGTGAVIGFFGVGGGFVIVPALVIALRFSIPEAIGTSLLVIVLSSQLALADRISSGDVNFGIAAPFAAAALAGVLIGRRLATRLDGERLRRGFAVLLALTAAYTAVRSIVAL